eukprot:TRINITY_DN3357_c0_g1_i20.p1 TRINITY_DN3357_c0_g1~~TRINITY_DN3357_c0_g1_i20.p1  ORF type:complete len:357 (-),score=81.13 TRINITY_DN3357_c0_g1_i20:61-1131(-)
MESIPTQYTFPYCKTHPGFRILFINLNKEAKDCLLCPRCFIDQQNKLLKGRLALLEDYLEERALFPNKIAHINKATEEFAERGSIAFKQTEQELDTLLHHFRDTIEKIKAKARELHKQNQANLENSIQSIKGARDAVNVKLARCDVSSYDSLMEFVKTEGGQTDDEATKKEQLIQFFRNLDKVFLSTKFFAGLPNFLTQTNSVIDKLYESFPYDDFKELKTDQFKVGVWGFDTERKAAGIELMQDNLIAETRGGSGAVLGSLNLRGKSVRWSITVNAVAGWIVFGMVDSEMNDLSVNAWPRTICIATDGDFRGVQETQGRGGAFVPAGGTVEFSYEADSGIFRATCQDRELSLIHI